MKHIDLRSDTVTQPTPAMREAMVQAPVGDDVFGEDPTVTALETKAAHLFGMEKALFCPSGTMTNQIALRILTRPQDEVICDHRAHIYLYEGGGLASNSLISANLLDGDRGRISAEMVADNIRPDDIHQPVSKVVAIENTMNKGGGSIYDFSEIQAIAKVCQQNKLAFHLDGARLFNALVETRETPAMYGQYFDTISICLSKGLGAPVGSLLLLKSEALYKQAKRVRKVMGGGMRQAGILAAAGLYALDHHVDRLREDHQRAKVLGETLHACPFVDNVYPVDTNIIIFETARAPQVIQQLAEKGILTVPFGKNLIRMVTHLDFNDRMLEKTVKALQQMG